MTELARERYIADRSLATVLFLARCLEKPVFLEGEPGVGKTEVAVVMSRLFDTELIRLQCYEGLDAASALYEWDYPRQLLQIRMQEQDGLDRERMERTIYSRRFLIKRPLLEAILGSDGNPPVLLIDEIDRSDEEFEAFLLEVLADFQVTIPEIGTLKAADRPLVVVTSNRTRDVHDALKRRCLYHWIDYPSFDKEYRIVMARIPGIEKTFARRITAFMQALRGEDFLKRPGISETLDWARALMAMHVDHLDADVVAASIGCILKYREDIRKFREEIWADPEKRAACLRGPAEGSGGRTSIQS
ncbi:MAG: MoxR family ATPase [Deltaproteobacteria bacterium]|nr:MAG: MoxR family ATPase [Deltaproteobacteria bacterium]